MRTLVVMAHYDALGGLAGHALRQIQALSQVADRFLVVSTSLRDDPQAVAEIEKYAEFVIRPNTGYDFYSYKTGLGMVEDLHDYDLVIICNDSYVGPLVPYGEIVAEMAQRPVDFWGLTETMRRSRHVQSFFVAFRQWVVRSDAFTQFWRAMTPISDRLEVIKRYEVGMSTTMLRAGFECGAYFVENGSDRRMARLRHTWWAAKTLRTLPRSRRRTAWKVLSREPWNPMAALADRALDRGRLPLVKIDTLRYDPYALGSERLLQACEKTYPEAFDGVRQFMEQTQVKYPTRPGEGADAPRLPAGLRQVIGYAR